MKTIITCGHQYSGFEYVFDMLLAAGVQSPKPSRREGIDIGVLHQKMLAAHDVASNTLAPLQALEPGKMWQELATDLFLGNIESPQWGWADTRSAWLLDFWKGMDKQVYFVLVYASPEYMLAEMVHSGRYSAEEVMLHLYSYQTFNAHILHFYARNPERCVLVELKALQEQPGRFIETLRAQWRLALRSPDTGASSSPAIPVATGAVAHMIARQLLQQHPQLHAMYAELQSAASLSSASHDEDGEELLGASVLTDYMALHQRQANDAIALEQQATAEQLKADLQELQRELEGAQTQVSSLTAELERERAKVPARNDSQREELEQENELLLLQLHQVQEELENYFLKHQQVAQELKEITRQQEEEKNQVPLAHAYWTRLHPAEVLIDLREPIRGSNWYEPELDGSWAGPGQTSAIHMPALRKGKYDMLIDVVDAMDATIIEGMKASLAGHPLELKKEVHDRSAVLRARVDTNQLPPEHEWTLQIEFPAVISPASHGSDDTRQLAVRIKTIKFKAVN